MASHRVSTNAPNILNSGLTLALVWNMESHTSGSRVERSWILVSNENLKYPLSNETKLKLWEWVMYYQIWAQFPDVWTFPLNKAYLMQLQKCTLGVL